MLPEARRHVGSIQNARWVHGIGPEEMHVQLGSRKAIECPLP